MKSVILQNYFVDFVGFNGKALCVFYLALHLGEFLMEYGLIISSEVVSYLTEVQL